MIKFTGGVLTPEDIDKIAELIENRDTYVFSDEIYDRLIYEGTTKSIASIPSLKDRVIVGDSFSKSYAMTDWRLGYGIMNPTLADSGVALLDGSSFGDNGKGYLRLSYANSEKNIYEALNRIDMLMNRLMKNSKVG